MWDILFGFLGGVTAQPVWNLIKNSTIPYIWEHTSDNIKLTDKWRVVHTGVPSDDDCLEAEWEVEVTLNQKGRSVFGRASAKCIKGDAKGREVLYEVTGSSLNGVVDVTFSDLDTKSRNRSAFLLQVIGPGDEMEGHRIFLGRQKNDVRSVPCKWSRKDAAANCGTA